MSTESTVSVAIPAALAAEVLEVSPEGQSIGEAVGGLLRMIIDEPPTEAELEPLIITHDHLRDMAAEKALQIMPDLLAFAIPLNLYGAMTPTQIVNAWRARPDENMKREI